MIIASRLFMAMGLFGLTAGAIYYLTNDDPELAGVGLLAGVIEVIVCRGSMVYEPDASRVLDVVESLS